MLRLFVPGRLCLFGEHSDWAGSLRTVDADVVAGACIVTGTEQGIAATAVAAPDFEITSQLPDSRVLGPLRLPMDGAALQRAARAGGFFQLRGRGGRRGVGAVSAARRVPHRH